MIIDAPKIITRLSVSQIETFDPDSTWGCPSKWWFKSVAKLPEGDEDPSKQIGTAMHKRIEVYLHANEFLRRHPQFLEGRPSAVRRAARGDHLRGLELAGKAYIDAVIGRLIGIEHYFDGELFANGVPLQGYIDALLADEVLDWKSTSNIARYAKTEKQMVESVQMVGYSKWFFDKFPHLDTLRNTQVFFQTKGKLRAEKVSCLVTRAHTVDRWTRVEATVRVMTEAARETNSDKVEKDRTKCRMGRSGCPYFSVCQPPQKDVDMNSLLDMFGVAPPPAAGQPAPAALPIAAAPAPVVAPPPPPPPAPAAEEVAIRDFKQGGEYVLPNTARARFLVNNEGKHVFVTTDGALVPIPYSDGFKIVAAPVASPPPATPTAQTPPATPAPVSQSAVVGAGVVPAAPAPNVPAPEPQALVAEAPKRGPGRPKKQPEATASAPPTEPGPPVAENTLKVKSIAIRHALTINLGNYQSARVEVELAADVLGVSEHARELLSEKVQKAIGEEAKPYLARAKPDAK